MAVKTIKDVDENSWAEFKDLAIKNNMRMGKFFGLMVEKHKSETEKLWDMVFSGEKILSDEEAEEMHKTVKELRKEKWFRE